MLLLKEKNKMAHPMCNACQYSRLSGGPGGHIMCRGCQYYYVGGKPEEKKAGNK